MTRGAIALGEDRHRPEAELTARANDAYRDLPAVGDQDLVQDPGDSTLGTRDDLPLRQIKNRSEHVNDNGKIFKLDERRRDARVAWSERR